MATRRRIVDRNQALMESAEARAAREVAAAYNQARRDLLGALLDRWIGTSELTPSEAQGLARRLGLLRAIDERLAELERETGAILRNVVVASEERALEVISRELSDLPPGIRQDLTPFTRINTQMVERFLPVALDEMQLAANALRSQLRREIQTGLIQGESFEKLVSRLMTTSEPSTFRNGRTSAERAVRRLVITAENAARDAFIAQAQRDIPELKRQVVATIGSRTTETCLRAHGQVRGIDEPFDLSGEPKFASQMMHPAFHWNCRTAVAAWHPRFESGGLNTANMERSAQAELRKRRST